MRVVAVFACIGLVLCSEPVYEKTSGYQHTESYDGNSKQLYQGMYPGKCAKDGFYYKNEYAFMMCSNGNSYEQRCAPGSKNSGHEGYAKGADYYIHDFCDVNMVDFGYNGVAAGHSDGYKPKPAPAVYKPKPAPAAYKPAPVAPKPAGYEVKHVETVEKHYVEEPKSYGHEQGYNYHGKYPGKCGADGFYYNNEYSFTMCSNGNAYVQKCAPGSRNSGHNRYNNGNAYYYNDFCDVNLVDYGYNAPQGNAYGRGGYYPNPRFYQPGPAFGYY